MPSSSIHSLCSSLRNTLVTDVCRGRTTLLVYTDCHYGRGLVHILVEKQVVTSGVWNMSIREVLSLQSQELGEHTGKGNRWFRDSRASCSWSIACDRKYFINLSWYPYLLFSRAEGGLWGRICMIEEFGEQD